MKISHEAPHKDPAFFVHAPLRLMLAHGREVVLSEWNLQGVRKPQDIEIFPTRGMLQIPFQGVDIQFPVEFRQQTPEGLYQFVDLTVRQRETLAVFYNSILSGKMATTGDIITSLDTPVDVVPMSETEAEKEVGAQSSGARAFQVVKALMTYAALACIVFGLLGQTIVTRATIIPVSKAHVVASQVQHLSIETAYIEDVLVEVGDHVQQGDVLIEMSDPRRDLWLDDTRRQVDQITDKLSEARARLREHDTRYDVTLARLQRQLEQAQRDDTSFANKVLDPSVVRALDRIRAFENGISVNEGDFHDIRQQLLKRRNDQKEEFRQAKRKLGIAKADARQLDIKAKVDGVVRAIPAIENQNVARGTSLIDIEEFAPRTVMGRIDDARSMDVKAGQSAKVVLNTPNGRITHLATVVHMSTSGEPNEDLNDLGFWVVVTVPQASEQELLPNTPAEIGIWKNWVPQWWQDRHV